jgi:hypothetical protein
MNPRNTCYLVVLAAALFAFIFFFERHLGPEKLPVVHVLPHLNPAKVTGIEIDLAGRENIRVVRTNDTWMLTRPLVYPAQSAAVDALLQVSAAIAPRLHISAQDLKGHLNMNEEYGFENPQATISFEQGAETTPVLKLGFFTAPGDEIYAQVVGLEGVDVLDADFFRKLVPHQANDWRDTTFINLKGKNFDRLTVANGAAAPFELRRDGTNEIWRMNSPVVTRANYPKINLLLAKLEKLHVSRFVTDNPQADLDAYGLQPPSLDLKMDDGTNHVLWLQFGKSPTNDDTHIYARSVGQNSIVLVPREPITPWFASYEEFRDRHLVRLAGGWPDSIQMFSTNHDFNVKRLTNDEWAVTAPFAFPADTNTMRAFIGTLTNMEAVRTDNRVAVSDAVLPDSDFPTYGLQKPARRYVLKEKATALDSTNDVIAEVDFGVAKDGKVYARRADHPEETSVYAIRPEDFALLPDSGIQLRERRIWNFSEDDVSKITIRFNGHVQELVHKGPNHWGIAAGSQGMISDELQIEVGAQELGYLAAQKWVERGDEDRARYGFTGHSLQLAVEIKINGKPQTLTLDFGGRAPDGLRYGDTQMPDGQNWIFEIPPVTLDRVLTYFNIQEKSP